jgi:hypothetical protein
MVSGITVGILKEQNSDHIILSDSSHVQLPDGLVLERFPSGCNLTILYRRDGAGEMVVESITRSVTSHLPHVPPSRAATDHRRWGYTNAGRSA